jgi:hypothetical protein
MEWRRKGRDREKREQKSVRYNEGSDNQRHGKY